MDISYLPLITLFLNLFVGIIIFMRGAKYVLARHFFILCMCISFWALFDFLSLTAITSDDAWLYGGFRTILSLGTVLTSLHFVLRLTGFHIDKTRMYDFLLYSPIIFFIYLRFFTKTLVKEMVLTNQGYDVNPGPLYYSSILFGVVITLVSFFILIYKRGKERVKEKRTQYLLVLIGTTIPILVNALAYVISPFYGQDIKYWMSLLMLIPPILIGFSVAKTQLLMPLSIFTGTIRAKIFTLSVFSTFFIILPGISLIYTTSRNNVDTQINQQIRLVLNQHTHDIENELTETYTDFLLLSKRESVAVTLSKQATDDKKQFLLDEIRRAKETSPMVKEIALYSVDYEEILSTSFASEGLPEVTKKLGQKRIEYSSILKINNDLAFYLVAPVFSIENEPVGFIIATLDTAHLFQTLKPDIISAAFSSTVFLVDSANKLLSPYADFGENIVLEASLPVEVSTVCAATENLDSHKLSKYKSVSGAAVYGMGEHLSSVPWCVVIEINTTEASLPLRNILLVSLIISILSIIAVTFISDWLGKLIGRPIEELEAGTQIIAAGNYNHRVDINSTDEIGALAKAFARMTESLKDSKTNVEEKVKLQTKDLLAQKEALIRQQQQMVKVLTELEDEKEHSDLLAQDLEKFQRAVADASDHIVITDANGMIVYANDSVERITGFSPVDVIGQKAGGRENWGGQMPTAVYKKMWTTIKVDKKPFAGELVNIKKDGQLYNVFATITPIFDKEENVQFFLGIERDITREKVIDKAKSEFVSLASHQLRTPLSAINWYTEMLLDGDAGPLTEEQKEYLHEIYNGNQRMVDLVTSLLNVSRLELGTFAIEPTKEDLVTMSINAIKELTPQITAKKLQVTETYGKIPPISVDKKLMYMVFQNIYSNAVKYNPEGGKVLVGVTIDKKRVVITATDTGMGIPKEEHAQIFTKLFRANNAKDSVTEGTGLGLYIVKSILDQAGGKISFTSEINKGTTFTVTLPLTGMKPKDGTKKLT